MVFCFGVSHFWSCHTIPTDFQVWSDWFLAAQVYSFRSMNFVCTPRWALKGAAASIVLSIPLHFMKVAHGNSVGVLI